MEQRVGIKVVDTSSRYIHCRSIDDVDLLGKVIIIKEYMFPDRTTLRHRLFRAIKGEGCAPNTHGTMLTTENIIDNDYVMWSRTSIEGWITDEELIFILNNGRVTCG